MSDAAYGERMDQLLTFSLVVCADLRAVSARLRQLDALRHVLPVLLEANVDTATGAFFAGVHYDRACHGAAGPEADPEAPEDPELSRLLDETEREADRLALRVGRLLDALTADAAADFLSMWEAWGRFSRQRAGVGPMDLMRAFEMPCCPEFAGVLERHEDAVPTRRGRHSSPACSSRAGQTTLRTSRRRSSRPPLSHLYPEQRQMTPQTQSHPPPSTHGSNGHDGRRQDGRFTQGNRHGRGNPLAGRRRQDPRGAARGADRGGREGHRRQAGRNGQGRRLGGGQGTL